MSESNTDEVIVELLSEHKEVNRNIDSDEAYFGTPYYKDVADRVDENKERLEEIEEELESFNIEIPEYSDDDYE